MTIPPEPEADGDRQGLAAEVVLGLLVSATRAGGSALRVAAFPARVVAGGRLEATERRLASSGRHAATRGRGLVADVAEEALNGPELKRLLDDALAGPLPETLLASVTEHRVAERLLESPAFERLLVSPELERLVTRVLSAPAVRRAVAGQTTSFAEGLREQLRVRLVAVDDRVT
jgi:hypothetical protein